MLSAGKMMKGGNVTKWDSASRMQALLTREQMAGALFEAGVTIKIRKKDLMKWPDDDEHLHQYRISVRVARSLVKFIKPYQKRLQNQTLKDVLKELQDPTSRMRELDVLVPKLADEPELQAMCREAQLACRAEFMRTLKLPEIQEKLTLVEEQLKHILWKNDVHDNGIDRDALASRVDAHREYCETTLDTVDFDDQEAVHDLRKQAKALRYITRELAACLPEDAGNVSGDMRKMQDKLGEWCDARVNAALITEICGEAGAARAAAFQAEAEAIMQEMKASRA